ncbi:MAG: hypothetical protein LBL83_14170 [Clostridiales bacterium]|nr:hypothetical protein [Clostridiales bacterium]
MADGYAVMSPRFDSVAFAPNPAAINGAVVISVAISETEIILYPEDRLSGEFNSGEV